MRKIPPKRSARQVRKCLCFCGDLYPHISQCRYLCFLFLIFAFNFAWGAPPLRVEGDGLTGATAPAEGSEVVQKISKCVIEVCAACVLRKYPSVTAFINQHAELYDGITVRANAHRPNAPPTAIFYGNDGSVVGRHALEGMDLAQITKLMSKYAIPLKDVRLSKEERVELGQRKVRNLEEVEAMALQRADDREIEIRQMANVVCEDGDKGKADFWGQNK